LSGRSASNGEFSRSASSGGLGRLGGLAGFGGRCAAAVLLAAVALAVPRAQDWNQWRGPARTGEAASFTPPAQWPAKGTRAWQVKAGEGHSSPIVAAGRAFLHSRIGDQEVVTAFDAATGRQIWRHRSAAPYTVNPAAAAHGKGPKSTPVVADGRLFTLGINGTLSALDAATGTLLWRKPPASEFDAAAPDFGTAMSPVVDGGRVIVHIGGNASGALTAFDVATGKVRWRWTGDGPAYASPVVVAAPGGLRQVITQSRSHVVGIDPANGDLLWRIPFVTSYNQNSVTPVVAGDLLIYAGIGNPLTAARLGRSGVEPAPVWRNEDVPMYMSSPVLVDGTLFGFSSRNKGQFFAVDARTGRTLWTGRGREAENAALVSAGGLLLATTTEGELVVLRRDASKFDVVKRYTVAESAIWAHPAPFGRGVLIKDADTLAFWTF
jgi:outer membrane protein assembly factor BamB